MTIDYITGVMCAVADHTLSSEVGFKGIARKVLIFLLVGIGHILDTQVIGSGSVLRTAVIFFYDKGMVINEEQAKTIEFIYSEFIMGLSTKAIPQSDLAVQFQVQRQDPRQDAAPDRG